MCERTYGFVGGGLSQQHAAEPLSVSIRSAVKLMERKNFFDSLASG
jgi:hypothetical protein